MTVARLELSSLAIRKRVTSHPHTQSDSESRARRRRGDSELEAGSRCPPESNFKLNFNLSHVDST